MRSLCLFAAVALLSAVPVHAADASLVVDARRLTVMMGQARDIETALGLKPPPEPAAAQVDDVYGLLVQAVAAYDGLASPACAVRAIPAELCAGPYRLPARVSGDAAQRAMTDETAQRLIPFWRALCDRAPKPANGDAACPME
jgi:hypothetical protein